MGTAELKGQARRAVHTAMANPAILTFGGDTYPSAEQIANGLTLTVRWHTKQKIIGERSADDVGIIEGVNRLLFNRDELEALGLTPARLAIVTIPDLDNKQLRLDYKEESDGPVIETWSVIEL